MNRKATIIIAIQATLIILLFWFMVFFAKDEYESTSTSGADESINSTSVLSNNNPTDKGAATLLLSKASQLQSGIKTIELSSAQHHAATASFASVEPLDGLLDMRTRYLAAMADSNVIRSSMVGKQQNVQRLQLLNEDDKNISDSAVQEARAGLHAEQAKLSASQTLAKGIHDSMQQQWGPVLSAWASQTKPRQELDSLMRFQAVLIKVSLPLDITPNAKTALQVSQIGGQLISKATLVSAAPQADTTMHGKTYFYLAPAKNLRAGMRVSTRLDSQNQSSKGVIVPHESVVWFANQAWVYQKLAADKPGSDKFVRRLISTEAEIEGEKISGWFNTMGFVAGDELVSSGAQLLLSEELKYQITNENDD
ncbi:MAG: hypothetical protein K9J03_03445 [Candidatus Methylopumilus sp.]|nr:hypothetical protein [Candidatus Methylopumilus sp.]